MPTEMARTTKWGAAALAGIVCVAVLVFSGVAAGSEPAPMWHVNGAELTYKDTYELNSKNDGVTEIVIPKKNSRVVCASAFEYGAVKGGNPSNYYYQEKFEGCHTYNLATGQLNAACPPTVAKPLVYNGIGTKVSSGAFTIGFGEECGIGINVKVNMEYMYVSYGQKEGVYQPAFASGTGTFGVVEATMTTSRTLSLVSSEGSGLAFGWY